MTAFQAPLLSIEDTVQDLRAMTKIVLHASETCEKPEWGEMRSTVNTMLYLILEKIEKLDKTHDTMWKTEMSEQKEARH